MTTNEIREKLGLKNAQVWAEEQARQNLEDPTLLPHEFGTRRTGRTTSTIVEGLSQVSRGLTVLFQGADNESTQWIRKQARSWAFQLGLNTDLILISVSVLQDHDAM
jgi:hypothetical protein